MFGRFLPRETSFFDFFEQHAAKSVEASHELRELLKNRSFRYTTLGMAAMTFALGGMAYWVPTFLTRQRHLPLDEANALFGGMTVASGEGAIFRSASFSRMNESMGFVALVGGTAGLASGV